MIAMSLSQKKWTDVVKNATMVTTKFVIILKAWRYRDLEWLSWLHVF